ncbi:SNF2 domain-containing protein CLASSY 3-like isoform X2 [Rhodamnia argentea]|uniref:SNF2 domain-containing protein CLASSY 3-like isoform X2 n=1 Tax=Rhodamnia argentea TaxID=178133 RepID=A0ABM3H5G5_9MYRT|nr:SNF2 domain-containing protein CLASSY 3-like isoform X2 [Rhodamnia argentea]
MRYSLPVAKRTRAQTRSSRRDRHQREEIIVDEVDEGVEFLGEADLIVENWRNSSRGLAEAEDVISIDSVDSADLGNGGGVPVVGESGFLDSAQSSSCIGKLGRRRKDYSHVDCDEGDVSSYKPVDVSTVLNSDSTMCRKKEGPLKNSGAPVFVQDGSIGESSGFKCDSGKKVNLTSSPGGDMVETGAWKVDEEHSYIEITDVSDETETSSNVDEMETSSSEDEMSSSEDNNADSEDEDYVGEKSTSSVSTDNSSSSSEEEAGDGKDASECEIMKEESAFDGPQEGKPVPNLKRRKASQCDITEEESASDRPREGIPVPDLKKRKVLGLKILTSSPRGEDDDKESDVNVGEERTCVALRTRSHFGRQGRDMMKVGTCSHPICLDDDDDLGLSHKYCVKCEFLINPDSHHVREKTYFGAMSNYRKARSKSVRDQSMDVKDDDISDSENRNPESFSCKSIKRKAGSNIDDGAECPQKECGKGEDIPSMKRKAGSNIDNAAECLRRECGKGEDFPFLAKRKRVRSPQDDDVIKILVDSIWDKVEISPKKADAFRDATCEGETNRQSSGCILPLKFTFGEGEPEQLEKSDYEKELDKLWDELDFCLRTREIDSYNANLSTDPLEKSGRRVCGRYYHEDYLLEKLRSQDSSCDLQAGLPSANVHGTVWDLIPGVRSNLYPHQREGFEFIWKNIAGGIQLDELRKQTTVGCDGGCIISHAPGTGKSRLTIVFLQTYMELFPRCRPVIIAPRSMLLTWEEEFQKWNKDIAFHNLNNPEFSGKESKTAMSLLRLHKIGDPSKKYVRMAKLYSWRKESSILGISYALFRSLTGQNRKDGTPRNKTEDEQGKILLKIPDLLVLDEGHTPRNDRSLLWKALCKVETQRRIILSGTPFQNNFDELFNTLCLARPKFAERISLGRFGNFPRKRGRKRSKLRGEWDVMTQSIVKKKNDGLEKLKAMIDPFVHVHKGTILKERLPGLRDSVIVLRPGELQKSLLGNVQSVKNTFSLSHLVSSISVHPFLFSQCSVSESEGLTVDRSNLESLREKPEAGVKTRFLMELIRLSEAMHEKVLVFSQFIDPLTFIRDLLKSTFHWADGKELLYMDGQADIKQRQSSINAFNDPTSEVRVLLASTRACSEGINLVGASRVVLLDVVWNPSVERQAISRAYRLGQENVVYIYHLITSGTIEAEKYCRQVEKDRLSELVFASSDPGQKVTSAGPDDKILEELIHHPNLSDMFERIIHQPKESNLIETFNLVDVSQASV